jgi:hypothetical protein
MILGIEIRIYRLPMFLFRADLPQMDAQIFAEKICENLRIHLRQICVKQNNPYFFRIKK